MSQFIPDPTFEKQFQADPELRRALGQVAEQGESIAKGLAPVDEGKFQASIEGVVVEDEEGRLVARVQSDDEKWPYLEFGTEDTPAFATLRQTADQIKF